MVVNIFPKTKDNSIVKFIRSFFDSIWMMILIVSLTALSNIFGIEIPIYYIYTFFIIIACLFCDDLISLFPIACCSYMSFAKSNNPMGPEQTSTFMSSTSATHMYIIAAIVCLFVIPRTIYEIVKDKDKRKMPKLLWGFLILGITNILGGLLSPGYGGKTAFFGLVETITLFFTYFCIMF